jgi:hypothetical protein
LRLFSFKWILKLLHFLHHHQVFWIKCGQIDLSLYKLYTQLNDLRAEAFSLLLIKVWEKFPQTLIHALLYLLNTDSKRIIRLLLRHSHRYENCSELSEFLNQARTIKCYWVLQKQLFTWQFQKILIEHLKNLNLLFCLHQRSRPVFLFQNLCNFLVSTNLISIIQKLYFVRWNLIELNLQRSEQSTYDFFEIFINT